jgi:hypothetical protein
VKESGRIGTGVRGERHCSDNDRGKAIMREERHFSKRGERGEAVHLKEERHCNEGGEALQWRRRWTPPRVDSPTVREKRHCCERGD